jgi:hypothetical protein
MIYIYTSPKSWYYPLSNVMATSRRLWHIIECHPEGNQNQRILTTLQPGKNTSKYALKNISGLIKMVIFIHI